MEQEPERVIQLLMDRASEHNDSEFDGLLALTNRGRIFYRPWTSDTDKSYEQWTPVTAPFDSGGMADPCPHGKIGFCEACMEAQIQFNDERQKQRDRRRAEALEERKRVLSGA